VRLIVPWVMLLVLACRTSWPQVQPGALDARPHKPVTAFVVTDDEAFVIELTDTSQDMLFGVPARVWRRSAKPLAIFEGEAPAEIAERLGWTEQAPRGSIAIPVADVRYAAVGDD
jgi:hypothetical protein